MEKINQFSIQRFGLLMKRYVMFNMKTWFIGMGALAGVLIVISALQVIFSSGTFNISPLVTLGQIVIFVGGFLITSMSYNEIHTPARSQFFLTLPATTGEKLFSHWIITSVIFVVVANILLMVTLLIASAIANLSLSIPIDVFNPFEKQNLTLMSIYLVVQSVFFLGALYFRKNNFLKTILSLFVIQLIINIFTFLVAYLIIGHEGFQQDMDMANINMTEFASESFPVVMKILFYGVLAPFCLLVSYFRLKEREV
ncbi:MAG: hypothetical protein ACOCXV_00265 [Bacteroidota bacterium]